MAYDVALFQLGMDLDPGSSTAQTEEKHSVCGPSVAQQQDRKDYLCVRGGEIFAGTHLLIDVVKGSRLDDLQHIENTFRKCIEAAGATLLHIHMHHFTPNGGVSGVAVLAESHISIHSWPEYGYAALDVFMCGDCQPHLAIDVIREAFRPEEILVHEVLRGKDVPLAQAA